MAPSCNKQMNVAS